MKKRALIALIPAALLIGASVRASDPPHWASAYNTIDCTTQCHTPHGAVGGNLTQAADNVNLCQSCHKPGDILAGRLPVSNSDKATPGTSGTSHSFDCPAVNAAYGADMPLDPSMSHRVGGGYGNKVICSSCHDQHAAVSSKGGTPRVSPATKVFTPAAPSPVGTGTVASSGTFAGTNGIWYLVEVVGAGTSATATFRFSKDSGTSWYGWDGAQWVPYNSNPRTAGASPILLGNSGASPPPPASEGLSIAFADGAGPDQFVAGERWEFYGAWPFLRIAMDSGSNAAGSKYCRDCHRSWAMDQNAVNVYDGTLKSHPVGIPMNANGGGYDRVGAILDGNGNPQGPGGDGNKGNDLTLDAGGNVQCLTCHAAHFAPSNTNAVIP